MTNELKNEQRMSQNSRTERTRKAKAEHKKKKVKKEKKQPELTKEIFLSRLASTGIKLLIFFIIIIFVAIIGLMIGFGVIGEGNPVDALKWETWQHILDIINGKE